MFRTKPLAKLNASTNKNNSYNRTHRNEIQYTPETERVEQRISFTDTDTAQNKVIKYWVKFGIGINRCQGDEIIVL